jgi:hypothetical protein
MRTILIAGLAVAGLGFAATGASAAPVNGTVIGDLAGNAATTVQYYGYRYGYRPYYRYGYGYRPYYNYGYRPYGYGYRYGYRYY